MSYALRKDPGGTGQGHNTNYVVAGTLKGQRGKGGGGIGPEETLIAAPLSHGSNPNSNAAGRRREDDFNLIAYDGFNHTGGGSKDVALVEDATPPLDSSNAGVGITNGASVRRLTPTECERLQGLPDGWTNPDGTAPDSRRYAGLGDAVTATVGEWLGGRILAAESARVEASA